MTRQVLAGISATLVLGGGGVFAADEQIDPYTDKQTHYELPIVSDIPQGERVEIHKDKAQMDLIGWNDEYKISIIPQIPTAQLGATDKPFTVPADRPLLSKRMEYKSGNVTAFIEPKEGTENEFDIDFTLDAKPDTNVFEYKIDGAEEFAFQLENTGLIQVFHKNKRNHRIGSTNYRAGKVFDIFPPIITDATGSSTSGQFAFVDNMLSITVPNSFLINATYPVTIDPTFGYTDTCSVSAGSIENIVEGALQTLTEDADVSMITALLTISTSNKNAKTAIYESDGTLVAQSNEVLVTNTASTYTDFTISTSISAGDYYLAAWMAAGTGFGIANGCTVCTTGNNFADSETYGATFPDPATLGTPTDDEMCIYATYTADAPPATSFPQNSPLIF